MFVAGLVAMTLFRELGPLMTAIILAGRSGSAFAAEIGTMKINEEIDALSTMGLDPVRFLVVTRILAGVAVMPFLTLFANFSGRVGASIVTSSMGYPLVTFISQIKTATNLTDLLGGLVKALVFGILVAGIGCYRGLETPKRCQRCGRFHHQSGGQRHRPVGLRGCALLRDLLLSGRTKSQTTLETGTTDPVIIRVEDVTAAYDGEVVLDHVSFEVMRGEIFIILGGSGCGKSTLLKHMIGL